MNASRTHPVVDAISALMTERRIGKTELARRLGWGRMQVHRRLNGEADLSVPELEQIAAALDVPLTQLIPTEPAR